MSSATQELLDEILAQPDDDRPRLVLADLLSQRGDPRGEFIALQCRAAADPRSADAPAWTARADALLAENVAEAVPARRWFAHEAIRVVFRRGFPDEVWGRQEAYLAAAPVPGLKLLHVGNCQDARTTRMASSPILRHVQRLELHTAVSTDPLANRGLAALASVPFRLRELHVRSRTGPKGFVALAQNPSLAGLDALELDTVSPGPAAAGLRALFASAPHLRRLQLRASGVSDGAAAALEELPPRVTRLDLGWNRHLGRGALHLASPALEELSLSGTAVDGGVVRQLLDRLPGLRVLTLRSTSVREVAHPRLAAGEVTLVTG